MTAPDSLLNNQGQRLDLILGVDGTVLYKGAVGQKTAAGANDIGAQWVGTHVAGDTPDADDPGVLLVGVAEDDGTLKQVIVDADGNVVVSVRPRRGSLIDNSDAITTGGTHQSVCGANPDRAYFLFQNISDTAMWINFGVNAVADQPSILIPAGGAFVMEGSFVSTETVDVMCATTGKKFVSKEG